MDIDLEMEAAATKGKEVAQREPRALAAAFDRARRRLRIELSSGAELSISPTLLRLPEDADLTDVQVVGGGFDLYFPSLDEGAYIPDVCRAAFEMRFAA